MPPEPASELADVEAGERAAQAGEAASSPSDPGVTQANSRRAAAETGRGGLGGPLPWRWLRAFGAFWWDFLVGDTPELFVGALVAIGVLAVLVKVASTNAAAVGAFPLLVVVLLAFSVARERRSKR